MSTLTELVETLSQDAAFKTEYERGKPIFEFVCDLVEARHAAGLTQRQVAARMKTTQSAIARIESGSLTPTFDTLERYAEACGMRIEMQLRPAA
jgi:predicted transcriptional regulator